MSCVERDSWLLATYGYIRMEKLKIVFPKELIELIAVFYRIPINSKIMTDDESVILYEMLCQRLKVKTIDWRLLWRGGDDGFGYDSFWNKCNSNLPSIVIVETKNCNRVFGGFAKVGFIQYEQERYTEDANAFLYLLRNKNNENHEPMMYSILKGQEKYALWFTEEYLCCFGNQYGSDIWIEQNCNTGGNNGVARCSYGIQYGFGCGLSSFTVNEMEVFQLKI